MSSQPQASDITLQGESGVLGRPVVLVHGGAGTFERATTPSAVASLEEGLSVALAAGWAVLSGGGSALDAVVEAVASLEDGGRFNAGRGAVPTSAGAVEFDAGVMDGTSGAAGAIAAATWPANPVRAARAVIDPERIGEAPVLLAGPGADRFAQAEGLPPMDPAWLTGVHGADDAPPPNSDGPPSIAGTVGAVALDASGALAAATSTGGRSGQPPGRVGDTPIPGAGVWAAGDVVAVSATGAGEAFVLAGFGHRVDWGLRAGLELEVAVDAALRAVGAAGGSGGGIALGPGGEFAARFSSRAMARGWRSGAGSVTRLFPGA